MTNPELPDDQALMISRYDRSITAPVHRLYYGYSDYYNYGYWAEGATSQKEASEALVRKLLSFIPEHKGRILDVACGLGASTRLMLEFYPKEQITGINLSEFQLDLARRNAPGVDFRYMDATELDFPDESFANIICVEASHHFRPREKFYSEALRVLEPGGRLVSCELGGPAWAYKAVPPKNAKELRKQLEEAGFIHVSVEEAVDQTWRGFCRNLKRWPKAQRKSGAINGWQYAYLKLASAVTPIISVGIRHYFLTSAQKPPAANAPVQDAEKAAETAGDQP